MHAGHGSDLNQCIQAHPQGGTRRRQRRLQGHREGEWWSRYRSSKSEDRWARVQGPLLFLHIQVHDSDDDELPDADGELATMARLRQQAISASREADAIMEGDCFAANFYGELVQRPSFAVSQILGMVNVTRGMMQGRPIPTGLPSMFPGPKD